MIRSITRVLAFTLLYSASSLFSQRESDWRVFSSGAGWNIRYPATLHPSSCQSCKDLHAPDVFISFSSSKANPGEGSVMIEHLADRPPGTSVTAWLADVARTANLNKHIGESMLTLNGLRALKVRYRTAAGGEMEGVYVVSGKQTFEISFTPNGDTPTSTVETATNYATYEKMLNSFRVSQR